MNLIRVSGTMSTQPEKLLNGSYTFTMRVTTTFNGEEHDSSIKFNVLKEELNNPENAEWWNLLQRGSYVAATFRGEWDTNHTHCHPFKLVSITRDIPGKTSNRSTIEGKISRWQKQGFTDGHSLWKGVLVTDDGYRYLVFFFSAYRPKSWLQLDSGRYMMDVIPSWLDEYDSNAKRIPIAASERKCIDKSFKLKIVKAFKKDANGIISNTFTLMDEPTQAPKEDKAVERDVVIDISDEDLAAVNEQVRKEMIADGKLAQAELERAALDKGVTVEDYTSMTKKDHELLKQYMKEHPQDVEALKNRINGGAIPISDIANLSSASESTDYKGIPTQLGKLTEVNRSKSNKTTVTDKPEATESPKPTASTTKDFREYMNYMKEISELPEEMRQFAMDDLRRWFFS